jgi:hypothetical protein
VDRILQAYMKTFASEQLLEQEEPAKQFEHFANFCIIYGMNKDRFDTTLVTTEPPEAGIDGVAFLLDDALVTTREEAQAIFDGRRRDIKARIVFIQAKRAEPFARQDVLKFSDAVKDFISDKPAHPMGSTLTNAREILELIIQNVGRVQGGRPDCYARYVTTGPPDPHGYGWAALKSLEADLKSSGLFLNVDVAHVHKEDLIKLWNNTKTKPEAKLEVKGLTAFPSIRGVNEAYIAIIPAKNFIENVLADEQGELRSFIFDENVRAFFG